VTFLYPIFLLALLAVAVPILLHLLRRQEKRIIDFPALRYLRSTTRESARVIRLRQLLLLLLRITVLVLLVLAGSRWILPVGGGDFPPAGVVLVVDNGVASGEVVGEGRALDSLVARGIEALAQTGSHDQIWVVAAGEPWRPARAQDRAGAERELRSLEPTHLVSDLGAALDRAAAILEAGAPKVREILLLTTSSAPFLPAPSFSAREVAIPLRMAPAPPPSHQGRGIAWVGPAGGLPPRAGTPWELEVRLVGGEVEGTLLRAYLDDRLVATGRAGPGGELLLPIPPLPAGPLEGRVEIDPDDLRADDVAAFAFQIVPPPTVRAEGDLTPYLGDALDALEQAGRIRQVGGVERVDVLILGAGASAPRSEGAPPLLLILPPEDPSRLPGLNALLGELLPGWRLEPGLPPRGSETSVDPELSAILLPTYPRVRFGYRVVRGTSGLEGSPLLTLAEGSPWLIRGETPTRSIFLLLSPLTPEASDLPSSTALVPLLDRITSGGGTSIAGPGAVAGDTLRPPPGSEVLLLPSGIRRTLDSTLPFRETAHAGVYRFLDGEGETLATVALGLRSPSGRSPLAEEEWMAALTRLGWTEIDVGGRWPDSVLEGRRGRESALPLLWVVLLLLLLEGWLAAPRLAHPARGPAPQIP